MKKAILIIVAISIVSCSKSHINNEFLFALRTNHTQAINKDIYSLDNCQKIFDSIVSSYGEPNTKGESKLDATHHVLKVKPNSLSQQLLIERDTSLRYSYHPFGEVFSFNQSEFTNSSIISQLSNGAGEHLPCQMLSDSLQNVNRYVSTLYVLWPADKTIPYDLDYELCYEVFDPYKADLPEDLRIKMLRSLCGLDFPMLPEAHVTLRAYDNLLNQYVPLKNVTIQADYGSIIQTYQTDTNGVACIVQKYGTIASCSYFLTQQHFSVRDSTNYAIVERPLGTINIGDPVFMTDTYYTYNIPEAFYEVVYQAADYYFNENSYCATEISQLPPIMLFGQPSNPSLSGEYFVIFELIVIYDNNQTQRQKVIGTTFHELSHYYQFKKRIGVPALSLTTAFRESFASCNAYFLGEQYYLSKGFIKPYSSYDIVDQGRQYWYPYISEPWLYYTPIFVDLMDDYSQHLYSAFYPEDNISGVSFETIAQMGKSADNLADIKTILLSAYGNQYSETQIDSQFSYYTTLF